MKLLTVLLLLVGSVSANIANFTLNSEQTLYVIDGDSISMQMRIAGIDTPEITQTCEKMPNQIIDCGRLSQYYLKKLLKNLPGKLQVKPKRIDHYQRVLVKVYKGDIDIGKIMVEAGMAYSYKDTYRQEEDLAKSKKIGFFGFHKPPIKPYKWRKIHRK